MILFRRICDYIDLCSGEKVCKCLGMLCKKRKCKYIMYVYVLPTYNYVRVGTHTPNIFVIILSPSVLTPSSPPSYNFFIILYFSSSYSSSSSDIFGKLVNVFFLHKQSVPDFTDTLLILIHVFLTKTLLLFLLLNLFLKFRIMASNLSPKEKYMINICSYFLNPLW